jgi:hypothetical protein|tara:strand:+ start:132 stop:1334 length:1203 start_codon:yes stop_codon:yes gene_type:complete
VVTDKGLLELAMESNSDAGALSAEIAENQESGFISEIIRNRLPIGAGLAVIGIILSWLLASPNIQSEYPILGLVPILIFGFSFFLISNSINSKLVGPVAVIYLLVAASPYIVSSVSTSSITIADSTLSSDSKDLTLKIRQSGGFFSETLETADISITYDGDVALDQTVPFSIDRNDAYGDYGQITLTISDFYIFNAGEINEYVITVSAGGSSDEFTLNSLELKRTITDADIEAVGYMGTGSDCSGNTENCVIGVVLSSWIGLDASIGNRPAGMQYANYNVSVELKEGGDLAIQYPIIEVTSGQASWDGGNGEFGEGSYLVGEYGSFLALDGSISAPEMGDSRLYIPVDDFQSSGEYGCYTLEIEISQSSPWSSGESISDTMFYEYKINGDTESWDPVISC